MITAYYLILLGLSGILSILYYILMKKHYSVYMTLLFTIIPISNIGFLLFSLSQSKEAALMSEKFSYLGGCFVGYLMMVLIMEWCKLEVNKLFKLIYFTFSMVMYCLALTSGYVRDTFYAETYFERVDDVVYLSRIFGTMLWAYLAMNGIYILMNLIILIYSLIKQKKAPRIIIILMLVYQFIYGFDFFAWRFISYKFEILPIAYIILQILLFIILLRLELYKLVPVPGEGFEDSKNTALISFDMGFRYLGCNEDAELMFPELEDIAVDSSVKSSPFLKANIAGWLQKYKSNSEGTFTWERHNRVYAVDVDNLYENEKIKGYRVTIWDDSKNAYYKKNQAEAEPLPEEPVFEEPVSGNSDSGMY